MRKRHPPTRLQCRLYDAWHAILRWWETEPMPPPDGEYRSYMACDACGKPIDLEWDDLLHIYLGEYWIDDHENVLHYHCNPGE